MESGLDLGLQRGSGSDPRRHRSLLYATRRGGHRQAVGRNRSRGSCGANWRNWARSARPLPVTRRPAARWKCAPSRRHWAITSFPDRSPRPTSRSRYWTAEASGSVIDGRALVSLSSAGSTLLPWGTEADLFLIVGAADIARAHAPDPIAAGADTGRRNLGARHAQDRQDAARCAPRLHHRQYLHRRLPGQRRLATAQGGQRTCGDAQTIRQNAGGIPGRGASAGGLRDRLDRCTDPGAGRSLQF